MTRAIAGVLRFPESVNKQTNKQRCAAVDEALLDIEDYKTIYKFFPEHELQLQAALMTECQTTPCENWKLSISDDDTVRVGEMI